MKLCILKHPTDMTGSMHRDFEKGASQCEWQSRTQQSTMAGLPATSDAVFSMKEQNRRAQMGHEVRDDHWESSLLGRIH